MSNPTFHCPSREVFYATVLASPLAKRLLSSSSLSELYAAGSTPYIEENLFIRWNSDKKRWESKLAHPGWVTEAWYTKESTSEASGERLASFYRSGSYGWHLRLESGDTYMNKHIEPISKMILAYLEENASD